jgi:hypothetical protein
MYYVRKKTKGKPAKELEDKLIQIRRNAAK